MVQERRQYARMAGICYLVTHVTSVLAVVAYGRGFLAAGITLELALALGCLGTGVLLWVLLRDAGPVRASTFALLRTVEAAVILAGVLPMVASLWLAPGDQSMATVLAQLHAAAFLVGQGLVISVNTVVLGWLLFAARAVPRGLAVLGLVGGAIVLVSNLSQLWGAIPINGTLAAIAAVPVFAFELWFAVYLIALGLAPRLEPSEGSGVPAVASSAGLV